MSDHLPLRIDYLGALNTYLRDLRGPATLAYELIQNADDAKNTRCISFDVQEDALVVENDGVFTDCGEDSAECPWRGDPEKGHRCDAHRFRLTAGGDKRREEGTTGAFGIGFISVYQITDRPEIRSGDRHWIIQPEQPEDKRIQIGEKNGGYFDGTRFRLPWASEAGTAVREQLEVEPIDRAQINNFLDELRGALPRALLFLRSLKTIEIKRDGRTVQRTQCEREGSQLSLTTEDLDREGTEERKRQILEGRFTEEANSLRAEIGGHIEEGRNSRVQVAFPTPYDPIEGYFYATLPTLHNTGLPVHINSDFYPAPNRNRVLLDGDYQGRWNKAAIGEAARIIGRNLSDLSELLGHQGLWSLFDSAYGQRKDEVFEVYWKVLQPKLSGESVVRTTNGEWVRPSKAHLLANREDEKEVVSILEDLGVSLAHLDLTRHSNLLQKVGVSQFSASDLADALESAGLDAQKERKEAPDWIKDQAKHNILAEEIRLLLGRIPQRSELRARLTRERLCECAIAWSTQDGLCPPSDLRQADDAIREVLVGLGIDHKVASERNPEPILDDLIAPLAVEDVIGWLENLEPDRFETQWRRDPSRILDLIRWFAKKRGQLEDQPELVDRLCQIPIWPSDDQLTSLDELVVPGDFPDPLGLTSVLHSKVVDEHRSFLTETLDATILTVVEYAKTWIPKVFETEQGVNPEKYEELLLVLGRHLGKLRDKEGVRNALSGRRVVRCADGAYRRPREVYFDTDVVDRILGDVPTIDLPEEKESIVALMEWLGVAAKPRPRDVVARVRSLTDEKPSDGTQEGVKRIVKYLGDRWEDFKGQRSAFESLKELAWLPAQANDERWFAPSEVYAPSRRYLFETQAHFLDIDRRHLRRVLREYLEIPAEPTPRQVVAHLLECAEKGRIVNRRVYEFLNRHAEENAIVQLRGESCLLLRTGQGEKYVRPDQVYWTRHPFGKYRFQLSEDMRSYGRLFKRLRVKEEPDAEDALDVLQEIGEEFGTTNERLEDDDHQVIMKCWAMLSDALGDADEEESLREELRGISNQRVVPNDQRYLKEPAHVFFEDRPQLAEKFNEFLSGYTIHKPQDAWQAMEEVGVRSLSEVVHTNLVENQNPRPDPELGERLSEWRPLIRRVLEASRLTDLHELDLLDRVQVTAVDRLRVQHVVKAFNRRHQAPAEDRHVYFDPPNEELYIVRGNGIHWRALSRELSYALAPEMEAGQIAPGLNAALSAETKGEAHEILNEYGYAQIDVQDDRDVEGYGPAELGGSEEAESDGYEESEERPEEKSGKEPEEGVDLDETETGSAKAEGAQDEDSDRAKNSESADDVDLSQPDQNGAGTSEAARETRTGSGRASRSGGQKSGEGQRRKRKRKGRMRSYVMRDGGESSTSSSDEKSNEVDEAGIACVMQYEEEAGREPEEKEHSNKGYDIESRDSNGRIARYIEVKSLSGPWDERGVKLTDAQFRYAQSSAKKWWLYVVENALSDDPNVIRIQDPANQADEFFFDDGWRAVAEEIDPLDQ